MSGASGLLLSLFQLPSLLVSLAAIVFAAVRWSRHPMASLLVVLGAGISLLARATAVVLPRVLSGDRLWWVYAAQGLVGTLGWAMVVAAVFVDRARPGTEPPAQRW